MLLFMAGPSKVTLENQPWGVVFAITAWDGHRMKPQIIHVLGAELTGKSQSAARKLIDEYFDKIIWSREKEEWKKMSEAQKMKFVRKARVDSNA